MIWGDDDLRFPVVLRLDVLILFDGPVSRDVAHANLLALVQVLGSTKRVVFGTNHLCGVITPFITIVRKSGDRSRHIVVLAEDGIPAILLDHQSLRLLVNPCHVRGGPFLVGPLRSARLIVDVQDLKEEDHVQGTLAANSADDLFLVVDERHLTNGHGVVLIKHLSHLVEKFIQTRSVGKKFVTWLEMLASDRGLSIGESLYLGNVINDVHSEAGNTSIQPEAHDVVYGSSKAVVLPVEIWLFS